MLVGPRNSVVSAILGEGPSWTFGADIPASWLTDTSPWVLIRYLNWDSIRDDYPELWVDQIHDYVHIGD